jgi:hypothetical protein
MMSLAHTVCRSFNLEEEYRWITSDITLVSNRLVEMIEFRRPKSVVTPVPIWF